MVFCAAKDTDRSTFLYWGEIFHWNQVSLYIGLEKNVFKVGDQL